MPATYNGIGTHYWGKQNVIIRDAVCSQCNRGGRLTSYDTTLFFVVLFLPVIPLGKKRILDACSSCTRHFVMPLKQYREARAKDYAEADRLMASATTVQEAASAVSSVLRYREPDAIYRLIRAGEARFGGTFEWNDFLSDAYHFLSAYAEAEAAAARSLAVRENPTVRARLAEFQFRRDDVDAGRATLAPLLDLPGLGPIHAVRMGVEALQRRGRHREALELLSRIAMPDDAPPALVKVFATLRDTSEKTLAYSLSHPEKYETEGDGTVVRRKPQRFARARWVAAAAAVGAFVYFGYSIFLGISRPATLVNGTDVAYTVTVDGKPYALQAHEWRPIRVREGDLKMTLVAPGYTGPTTSTFTFASSVFRRPFDYDALVLNPDRLASIVKSEVTYGPRGGNGRPPTYFVGDVGYVLPSIDYAFTDPPGSVSTKSNETPPRYDVAYVDKNRTPADAAADLRERHEDARAATVARALLTWPIADAEEIEWALDLLGPAESIAALAPRAALRPIERESHRAFQNMREAAGQQAELVAEYERLLAADPENATLIYLLARTRDDDQEAALALYRRAQHATPPEPMGFVGEAYLLSARGEFGTALTAMRAARAAMPRSERLRNGEIELLIANGRHAELLAMLDASPPAIESPTDFRRRLQALVALGRVETIDGLIAARKAAIAAKFNAEDAALDERISHMALAYLRHDERGYAEACPVDDAPALRLTAALSRRDLAEAEKLIEADRSGDEATCLLLYLAASDAGDANVAGRALAKAIAAGKGGAPAEKRMAEWLVGDRVPSERELREWKSSPAAKSAALAALATARPALRPTCAPLAETFNYNHIFPHELVAASLAKRRPS